MARRRGSGRGKSAVNSRKSALETAREKLKADPGGISKQQNVSNMETTATTTSAAAAAAAAAVEAATLPAKVYHKTKMPNNHRTVVERRGGTSSGANNGAINNVAAPAAATGAKRGSTNANSNNNNSNNSSNNNNGTANLQTYRSTPNGENHVSDSSIRPQKMTAKQMRANAAAASAESGAKNDPLAAGAEGKGAGRRDKSEQKTVGRAAPTMKAEEASVPSGRHNNEASSSSSTDIDSNAIAPASGAGSNSSPKTTAGNKNTNSDSSSNSCNRNFTLSTSDNSEITKPHIAVKSSSQAGGTSNEPDGGNTSDSNTALQSEAINAAAAASGDGSIGSTWIKYLHKKFKRLASTTEVDSAAVDVPNCSRSGSGSELAENAAPSSSSSTARAVQSAIAIGVPNGHLSRLEQQQQQQYDSIVNVNCANTTTSSSISAIASAALSGSAPLSSKDTRLVDSAVGILALTMSIEQKPQPFSSNGSRMDGASTPTWNTQSQGQLSPGDQPLATAEQQNANTRGQHICPYCSLNCTKPSVLQKHIRAHTNERPYPCDICGIAFKTKSNYYKHCRSRSHGARKRGIEVPPDADDGLFGGSDQEGDLELSNSSSDVLSRTASPLDECSNSSPGMPIAAMHHHQNVPQSPHLQRVSQANVIASPTPSPSSISAARSTFLQQPVEQQAQQLPLGSPAAGTLPPTTATIGTDVQRQSIEHKPYKPKFHNAALYTSTKDAAGKPSEQSSHQQQHQHQQATGFNEPQHQQKLPTQQQQQHHHQFQPQLQLQSQPTHHPSLSPSTQLKLNNHINSHQLLVHFQQQQQQQQQPPQPHVLASPNGGVYYLTQPPAGALLHPPAHLPQQYFLPSVAHQQALATYHMMTPQQQQQLHHQMQLQQQHLHQHQLQLQQQHQLSTAAPFQKSSSPSVHQRSSHPIATTSAAALPPPPPQQQQQQPQQQPQHQKQAQPAILYVGGPATASAASSIAPSSSSNSLYNNISSVSAAVSSGNVHLNKEFLQEHISKLISENEAIVENKELLLQKKYPKTLNRSRSFTNANNNNNNNTINVSISSANTNHHNLVAATTVAAGPESANAKLAQAIVHKQQQQQLQQQLQQQQQQQTQPQPQPKHFQHIISQHHLLLHQHRPDDTPQQPQPHLPPLNGISKPIIVTGKQSSGQSSVQLSPQQQYRQQTVPQSLQAQAQHTLKEIIAHPVAATSQNANLPLNLSAKPKAKDEQQSQGSAASGGAAIAVSSPLASTPRKRQSIEQQASTSSETSSSGSSASIANAKHPQNNSIIKNLLLNARGLAVPTGEGEDAVYVCPLCSLEFRTAEDLQLHNSTYCQGASSSAPISPVSSPSYKYFRSNSISLNLPGLKNNIYLSRNPLSLAKLAWSQLKTKPSSLVLSQLSASQSVNAKGASTTTTTSSSVVNSVVVTPSASASTSASAAAVGPSSAAVTGEGSLGLVYTPLPSPGPLLGKTPLVDPHNYGASRKSEDVVITKMHEDRSFGAVESGQVPGKRPRYDISVGDNFILANVPSSSLSNAAGKRFGIHTSGGAMQLIAVAGAGDGGLNKKDERLKRFASSGGCMIPISECTDIDQSPKMIRTPLLSGGCFQEVSPKQKDKEGKGVITSVTPKLSAANLGLPQNGPQYFQFPPINSITGFNPLTLPPVQAVSNNDKIIPYVPGIPGPNSLVPQLPPPPQNLRMPTLPTPQQQPIVRTQSPSRKKAPSPMLTNNETSPKASLTVPAADSKSLSPFGGVQNVPSEFNRVPPSPALRTHTRNWITSAQSLGSVPSQVLTKQTSNSVEMPKKCFNFLRMADNLSPRKGSATSASDGKQLSLEKEERGFRSEPVIDQSLANHSTSALTPLHVDTSSLGQPINITESDTDAKPNKTKFLRPTSLPLKPGTFTPKRHHGITPTANTLPLISPETPRPSKACVQLYLNGHAYTYLGLKSSTKMFYCTVNCPQPSYVAGMHKLSMYSVWQVCAENNPHPLGFKPKVVIALYDSRQKISSSTMAGADEMPYSVVISQQSVMTPFANNQGQFYHHQLKQIACGSSENSTQQRRDTDDLAAKKDGLASTATGFSSSAQALIGGYESHEDYTYIRGRGRGRYVCSECGIRCKKPSMLKKHIRTHTDVRPYTCKHCNFSFKTKGNLTKHMQSKTHYKKCIELGINPGPMPADGEFLEPDMEFDQQSSTSAGGRTSSIPGESDSDDFSDNETESSDTDESKSRLQEHEAARSLLSLSMTPPITQSVSPQLKSDVYSYQHSDPIAVSTTTYGSQSAPASQQVAIKRVVSFTSPKPPFDYQKQEQYYSNPEESKPKRSAIAGNICFESAPIDLTKPRPSALSPPQDPTFVGGQSAPPDSFMSSIMPGPVQTQAQIHDVIFGRGNNESGFLKTLISVSDKVRISAENAKSSKKLNENILLQAYLTEQALQYTKMKQSQMTRGFPEAEVIGPVSKLGANSTPTLTVVGAGGINNAAGHSMLSAPTTTTTTNIMSKLSAFSTSSSSMASCSVSATITSNIVLSASIDGAKMSGKSIKIATELPPIPTIEVTEVKPEPKTDASTVPSTSSAFKLARQPSVRLKSLDEGDESESPSDQEAAAGISKAIKANNPHAAPSVGQTIPESYNAKLPAAVQQPGTTDFTGVLSAPTRTVIVGEDGLKKSANFPRAPIATDGRPVCTICLKTFQKQHQLVLHMNIHYMERKFKCESCGVSFRTQGHLQKHERSEAHKNKVMMTSTFGVPTTSNPRPFECTDCKIAFRIHGHLAKHLRSKTHVQKLECLQKLPFGTYAEIERAGISLTEIDTSDCDNSLISLKLLAQKLIDKDPTKLGSYTTPSGMTLADANSNAGVGSQDSASEDGFSAAASAAASAIASLDNDSAANTPKRASSLSEDETIANGLNNNLKRRLPCSFSNSEESDHQFEAEKRVRFETLAPAPVPPTPATSVAAPLAVGSPASNVSNTSN